MLEEASVAPGTRQKYLKALVEFEAFLAARAVVLTSPSDVDKALTDYLNFMFMDGHEIHEANFLYAAWIWSHPDYGSKGQHPLPRTVRAINGWRKLAPGFTRPPMPWACLALTVQWLLTSNNLEASLAILTIFVCYLRPSEALRLPAEDLVEPSQSCPRYALLLHGEAEGQPSKVGLYNESMLLDSPELPWLGAALAVWRRARSSRMLFDIKLKELREVFAQAQERVRLKEKYILYQLRHAGPSHDIRSRHRTLADVKRRGRWAADSSVARYESHALIQKQEHKEGDETMKRGLAAVEALHLLVSQALYRHHEVNPRLVSSKSLVALGSLR